MPRGNCVVFAFSRWFSRGGYLIIHKSAHGWWPHFLWSKDLSKFEDFAPVNPRHHWFPPLLFKGKHRVRFLRHDRKKLMTTEIPKITDFHNNADDPGWFCPTQDGNILKPVIRCNCGNFCGIGLHHVHIDGTVTRSFYHKKGTNFAIGESPEGCEWHVFLKLKDYDQGEFLPRT